MNWQTTGMKIALAISLASALGCMGNPAGTDTPTGTNGSTSGTKKTPTPKPTGAATTTPGGGGDDEPGTATPAPGASGASTSPTATPDPNATATPTADPTSTPAPSASSGGGLSYSTLATGEKYFYVRVENLTSTNKDLTNKSNVNVGTALSPIVWAVHATSNNPLFKEDEPASSGLQSFAEDGETSGLLSAVSASKKGVADTPIGTTSKANLAPGQSYHFVVAAKPGDKLVLATQMNESNDTFFATSGSGIALWDDTTAGKETPIAPGDVSTKFEAFDAGTEVNETFAQGDNQLVRQSNKNTGGPDTTNKVRSVTAGPNGLPASLMANRFIRVTINEYKVKMTLQNVSDSKPVQLSDNSPRFGMSTGAGVFTAYNPQTVKSSPNPSTLLNPYFVQDSANDKDAELVKLAKGAAYTLGNFNDAGRGTIDAVSFDPMAPGSAQQVVLPGVQSGLFYPTSATDDTPKFTSQRLFMATRLKGSPDLFFSFKKDGLKLFDDNFKFLGGDVTTSDVLLWDAGELQMKSGVDSLFATGEPTAGDVEADTTTKVREASGIPSAAKTKILKVSITIAD